MTGASLDARVVTTSDEHQQIYKLRYAVYVEEMRKPYPRADTEHGILRDMFDDNAVLVALIDANHRIVGSVRCNSAADVAACEPLARRLMLHAFHRSLFPHITVCSRLVVAPGYRRRGSLSPLVREVYRWGLQHHIELNLIHTALPLVPLFEHLGFRRLDGPFIDVDAGSEQQPLFLLLRDMEHLRSVNSPFVGDLERFSAGDCVGPFQPTRLHIPVALGRLSGPWGGGDQRC